MLNSFLRIFGKDQDEKSADIEGFHGLTLHFEGFQGLSVFKTIPHVIMETCYLQVGNREVGWLDIYVW